MPVNGSRRCSGTSPTVWVRGVRKESRLNIRNEELAHEANITIFTASRFLSEWQRKGILTKSRGKVVLRSPETLMLSEA
ncbi:MAG: helix-turn-helix domain-containing protein [Alloacidobacterium sp.]